MNGNFSFYDEILFLALSQTACAVDSPLAAGLVEVLMTFQVENWPGWKGENRAGDWICWKSMDRW